MTKGTGHIRWKLPVPNWVGLVALLLCFGLCLSVAACVFWLYSFASHLWPAMQVQTQQIQVFSDLKDAESGQRGYLLTGDDRYLFQYLYGSRQVRVDVRLLAAFVAERPENERAVFRLLSHLIDMKLLEIDKTIEIFKKDGATRAVEIVRTNEGLDLMSQIRDQFDTLRSMERNAIRKRNYGLF